MSKKNYRHDEWTYGYEEDYYGDRDHIEDVTHKRKIKRIEKENTNFSKMKFQ